MAVLIEWQPVEKRPTESVVWKREIAEGPRSRAVGSFEGMF